MTSVDSLIQDLRLSRAYKKAYEGSLDLGQVARNIVSEVRSPLEAALEALKRYEDQLPAVTSGAESVKAWEDGIISVRSDLVRKNVPAEVLDRILDVVITIYNERHLKEGIAYTTEEVSKDALVQSFGIDENYIVRFISEKMKKVAGVELNGLTYYGVKTHRNLDFVKRRLKELRDKNKIRAQDLDITNAISIGTLLSKNYKNLCLEQRTANTPTEYYWHNQTHYSGSLADAIEGLVKANPEMRIFIHAEVAYHFDTGTAPVSNIFRAMHNFREIVFRGKKASKRIPQYQLRNK